MVTFRVKLVKLGDSHTQHFKGYGDMTDWKCINIIHSYNTETANQGKLERKLELERKEIGMEYLFSEDRKTKLLCFFTANLLLF
jgi:hypothetical protein